MNVPRPNKHMYYLNFAYAALQRSTCLRRKYGAVLVKDDIIIGTGYTGSPRGVENCSDRGTCPREEAGVERGKNYELCSSVHAEMNAIINSNRDERIGATLYLVGVDAKTGNILQDAAPCSICARLIKNSRIAAVITYAPFNEDEGPQDYFITRADSL